MMILIYVLVSIILCVLTVMVCIGIIAVGWQYIKKVVKKLFDVELEDPKDW